MLRWRFSVLKLHLTKFIYSAAYSLQLRQNWKISNENAIGLHWDGR
jgi:hypothetical protein